MVFATNCVSLSHQILQDFLVAYYLNVFLIHGQHCQVSASKLYEVESIKTQRFPAPGFGQLYPCTIFTRVFLIFYAIIGVPLTAIMIVSIGQVISKGLEFVYHRIPPRQEKDKEVEQQVPVGYVAMFLPIVVLLAVAYYTTFEKYDRNSAFIYGFYTFSLGDYSANNYKSIILLFTTVLVGLSLVGTVYDTIQNNIRKAMDGFLGSEEQLKAIEVCASLLLYVLLTEHSFMLGMLDTKSCFN